MPFEQTDAEREKIKVDLTPWSEAAVAVQRVRTSDGLNARVIIEGTLLTVATKLIYWTAAELRSVRVSLPEHRHAGHSFQGPALFSLLAKARLIVEAADLT